MPTSRKQSKGRSYAGFDPARRDDILFFAAVLSGDYLLRGFRNGDIRLTLWRTSKDPDERRRHSKRVTRLLKRLHVRGLLAKIPRTRRWPVTLHGHKILGTLVQLHYHGLSNAA